jgi:hypothetical protein
MLTVENAASTGQRPLSYRVEVAADAGFSTMVFSKDGITPGGNGRTSVQVADKLAADRTYFLADACAGWRQHRAVLRHVEVLGGDARNNRRTGFGLPRPR